MFLLLGCLGCQYPMLSKEDLRGSKYNACWMICMTCYMAHMA